MAYIGKYETRSTDFKVYTSTTATATHTLSWTPTSKQSLRITINGVVQQDNSFSLSGNTVTLDSAILSTDYLEIVGVNQMGNGVYIPADGSIQAGKLSSNAVTTAKIQDDAVTLAKMADGTQGGVIHYGAAGAPVELAAGTDGYFLKTQGAGANPAWAAVSTTSDIELLNTYEPSNVASVEVNTAAYFTAPYKALKFQLINMHPITDNVHLRMYFGYGDPVDYTGANFDTNFAIMQSDGGSNWWQYETSYGGSGNWNSTFATLFKEVGNGTAEMCSGDVTITGSDSSTFFKTYQGMFTGRLYHSYVLTCFTAGVWDDQPAFTSIKFQFNSGNIDTGIIKLYGLR